jgi:hypothetical protein
VVAGVVTKAPLFTVILVKSLDIDITSAPPNNISHFLNKPIPVSNVNTLPETVPLAVSVVVLAL